MGSLLFSQEKKVCGIGDTTLDFLTSVDDSFVEYLDIPKGNAKFCDHDFLSETLGSLPNGYTQVSGGCVANTIRFFADMGEKTAFACSLGEDNASKQFIADYFETSRIERRGPRSLSGGVLNVISMVTPDTERSFLAAFSGEKAVMPSLQEDEWDDVEWLHLGCWGIGRDEGDMESVFKEAKARSIPVSLSLASPDHTKHNQQTLLHLISSYVNLLFCNEQEAISLVGGSAEEACLKLQELVPLIVITRGKQGCIVGSDGACFASPGFGASAIDTTGAGDLFAGGFLYAYLHHQPLEKCAKLGNFVASEIVQVLGGKLKKEQIEKIQHFISTASP
jgi:sugar/nucleoside kinase (ribokinase family)